MFNGLAIVLALISLYFAFSVLLSDPGVVDITKDPKWVWDDKVYLDYLSFSSDETKAFERSEVLQWV